MVIFTKTHVRKNKKVLGNGIYLIEMRVTLYQGLANYKMQARSGPK